MAKLLATDGHISWKLI